MLYISHRNAGVIPSRIFSWCELNLLTGERYCGRALEAVL
jgi:hypothetical protein